MVLQLGNLQNDGFMERHNMERHNDASHHVTVWLITAVK